MARAGPSARRIKETTMKVTREVQVIERNVPTAREVQELKEYIEQTTLSLEQAAAKYSNTVLGCLLISAIACQHEILKAIADRDWIRCDELMEKTKAYT